MACSSCGIHYHPECIHPGVPVDTWYDMSWRCVVCVESGAAGQGAAGGDPENENGSPVGVPRQPSLVSGCVQVGQHGSSCTGSSRSRPAEMDIDRGADDDGGGSSASGEGCDGSAESWISDAARQRAATYLQVKRRVRSSDLPSVDIVLRMTAEFPDSFGSEAGMPPAAQGRLQSSMAGSWERLPTDLSVRWCSVQHLALSSVAWDCL